MTLPYETLTPQSVRQFTYVPNNHRPHSHSLNMGRPPSMAPLHPMDPQGLSHPAMPPTTQGFGFGPLLNPVEDQRYSVPMSVGPGASSTEPGSHPGYSQGLPPVGALDGSGYQGGSNPTNSHHQNTLGEGWLQ